MWCGILQLACMQTRRVFGIQTAGHRNSCMISLKSRCMVTVFPTLIHPDKLSTPVIIHIVTYWFSVHERSARSHSWILMSLYINYYTYINTLLVGVKVGGYKYAEYRVSYAVPFYRFITCHMIIVGSIWITRFNLGDFVTSKTVGPTLNYVTVTVPLISVRYNSRYVARLR